MPREVSVASSPTGTHAYAQKSIAAGESVQFRVSSDQRHVLSVVRLGANPDGGSLDVRVQDFPAVPAHVQPIHPGSYVHVENGLPATQALGAFSAECWVRPFRTDVWQGLITQHTYPSACGFGLFIAGDHVQAYLGTGGAFQSGGLFQGPAVQSGVWSHVVLTWNGQQATLHVNGQSQPGIAFAGPLVPGSAPLRLGAYGSVDASGQGRTGQFLDGDLAMPVLYSRALTVQEIQGRASARPPTVPALTGVLACWPLTEERGTTLADVSGSGRTGAIINQASWMIGGPGYNPAQVSRYGTYVPAQDATRGHGLRFASDDLYDCGWSVTHSCTVPVDAKPGLYVGRISSEGGATLYEVPFVVRRPASRPRAQVLVLCATNTWLAYSSPFAGQGPAYSCYTSHAAGQPTFQVGLNMPMQAAGAYSLYSDASVNYSHLVRAERFLHQWLERNDYAYDMVTDLDLDRDPGLLSGYKVLVINGHSEYWSVRAWQAVDDFLVGGGSVAALSGNSLFWRVSFDASGTVMECRKYDAGQGFGGLVGTVGELWHSQDFQRGGLLRECGYPGWKLLGLEASGFVGTEAADFISLTVEQSGHFLYDTPQGVGAINGGAIGQAPGGNLPRAVGHEWDARVVRLTGQPPPGAPVPVEPAGITTLATAQKSVGVLDYYGRWRGTSTIVSEIIHWDRPQGGHVFYVGTIGAGWALQADVALQRLMHNVLYHFGVTTEPAAPAVAMSAQGRRMVMHRGLHGALRDKSHDGTQWLPAQEDWHGVGNAIVGAPAAIAWGPYVTLMAVGSEGGLQSRWWDGMQWGPSDAGWQDLGGQLAGTPVAVSRAPWGNPNGFDVFALGRDGAVRHKWWDGAQWGPVPGGWNTLGGQLAGSPVAVNWGAYVTVLAVAPDGTLQGKYWNGTQWGPSETGWQYLGGQLAGPLAVVSRAPANAAGFDIFALGRDGTVQHKWWDGAQWGPAGGGWNTLGGDFAGPPAAVAWGGGGKMSLFAVGKDGQLWTKWWDGVQWNPSPTGWSSMGGGFLGPVTALRSGADRIDLFAVGTDRAVWTRWWEGGAWLPTTGWVSLGV
jgi:N,N-dimethylformamidase